MDSDDGPDRRSFVEKKNAQQHFHNNNCIMMQSASAVHVRCTAGLVTGM
jgi:hypothetical protein